LQFTFLLSRCQFHQHFTRALFVQKSLRRFFLLSFFSHTSTNMRVKHKFPRLFFDQKILLVYLFLHSCRSCWRQIKPLKLDHFLSILKFDETKTWLRVTKFHQEARIRSAVGQFNMPIYQLTFSARIWQPHLQHVFFYLA